MAQTGARQKSTQRQFLVKVEKVKGYWQTKSGGNQASATTKVWDGGALTPDVIAGLAELDDITISRAYEHDRDGDELDKLRDGVGIIERTLSVTPTRRNLEPYNGKAVVYPQALLIGITEPDVDSGSGEPATYSLTWAVGRSRSGKTPLGN